MARGKGGTVHIPWYATILRGDTFADALSELAPAALHYGATSYSVVRSRDDRYRFLMTLTFDRYDDFTAFWEGRECQHFRTLYGGWFQIPVMYEWYDELIAGSTHYAGTTSPN
jgi:hypothetical protein